MKKSLILIVFIILTCFPWACQPQEGSTTTEAWTTTEPITTNQTTTIGIDAVFPSYDDYDEALFTYADVRIVFLYDYPTGLTTREEKRAYFEAKNQTYFENSGLDEAQFDDVSMSSYSSSVGLTYTSKRDLLEDFDMLKRGYDEGYYGPPQVFLKTIGSYYVIDDSSSLENMIEVTDQYFGTEITYESIPFTLLVNEASQNVVASKAYETYQDYVADFPSDPYDIDTSLFDTRVLIIVSFGHSGSLSVEGIDAVFYLDDDTLEVAIQASAQSIVMTEDFNPRTMVLSIPEEDYVSGVTIRPHFHTFFADGTYADRPYHNTVDDRENNEGSPVWP